MNNFFKNILLLLSSFGLMCGIGYIAHQFFDWWIAAFVAAFVCFALPIKSLQSFGIGFTSFSLLWGITAYYLNAANMGLLSTKMGMLFGGLTPMQLIYATGMLGGIIGGFGAMTGSLARQTVFSPKTLEASKEERLKVGA